MQNKLLPCPFCGGEAEVVNPYPKVFLVWCKDCRIGTTNCQSRKQAIEKWNTRKPLERIVEQLKEEAYETEVWDERYTDKYYKGVSDGCNFAIEIIKGGVDNATN